MKKQKILIASGVAVFLIIFFVTDGISYFVNYQPIILKFDKSNWLYSPGDKVSISISAQPNSSLVIKVFSPRSNVVVEENIDSKNGQTEFSFNLASSIIQGTYTVIVYDESVASFPDTELLQMNYHEKVAVQKITVI